jgi:hypothetical protein
VPRTFSGPSMRSIGAPTARVVTSGVLIAFPP